MPPEQSPLQSFLAGPPEEKSISTLVCGRNSPRIAEPLRRARPLRWAACRSAQRWTPVLQAAADKALKDGLEAYDRRHGYRGPIQQVVLDQAWQSKLATIERPLGLGDRRLAIVLKVDRKQAHLGFADGTGGFLPYRELRWAAPTLKDQKVGRKPRRVSNVVAPGDVIAVMPVAFGAKKKPYPAGTYKLDQTPNVDGAIVAIDPPYRARSCDVWRGIHRNGASLTGQHKPHGNRGPRLSHSFISPHLKPVTRPQHLCWMHPLWSTFQGAVNGSPPTIPARFMAPARCVWAWRNPGT